MPVLLIVSGIVAVIFTLIASYVLIPVEFEIHGRYNATTERAQDILDQQAEIFYLGPPAFVGAIFLALIARAARKDRQDTGDF